MAAFTTDTKLSKFCVNKKEKSELKSAKEEVYSTFLFVAFDT